MGEESKSELKVTDKRRFDSDGREREVEEQPKQKSAQAEPQKESPAANASEQARGKAAYESNRQGGEPAMTFSSFVVSVATQALMQLGQIKPPEGVSVEVDKMAAQQTIDIITMLAEKTRGNLDAGEKSMLEEVLHHLRMAFIKVV